MARFDPIKERETLLSNLGVRRELAQAFDEDLAKGLLTHHALFYIGSAVQCVLVGLDTPATWLLEKAKKWLTAGISASEDPYRRVCNANGTRALQYEQLAQCNWLLTGRHDTENLREAVRFQDRYHAECDWDQDAAEVNLPLYWEAGEFARAVEIFEGIPEIVLPGNLAEINREGSMAYVMCLHQLGRGYTDAEVQAATEQFLKRSVRDWLDRGQFPTVARWMKLAYWRGEESRQAAWQSLLRCYDFLPGVKRPTG